MYKIVRQASLELQALDSKKTVKVAGILRRLKNVFKQITDKEFANQVDNIRDESYSLQNVADHLNKRIDELLSAIKDGDVQSYELALDEVKDLSIELTKELKQLNQAAKAGRKEVQENSEDAPVESTKLTEFSPSKENESDGKYGPDTWRDRRHDMSKTLKEQRPEHDVPVSENLNKHFSDFSWFNDAVFAIPKGSQETILRKITSALFLKLQINPEESAEALERNWGEFTARLSEAIKLGTIFRYSVAKPEKGVRRKVGEMNFLVSCKTFELPGLGVNMSARFKVTDLGFTTADAKVLNIFNIDENNIFFPGAVKKASSRLNRLRVYALASQQAPFQVMKIDDIGLAKALAEGYRLIYGSLPSREVLGSAWAQATLERSTSLGLPNYNIGNIKASGDWIKAGKPYFVMNTKEVGKDGKEYTEHGTKWRAYESPAEGAAGYWQLLGGRYKDAVKWMAAGDPVSASVVLGEKGYYTANVERYSTEVGKRYQTFLKKIANQLPQIKSEPQPPPAAQKPAVVDKRFRKDVPIATSKPSQTSTPATDEADQLLGALFAMGPVEKMVAKKILAQKLPMTSVIVSLSTLSAPFGIRLKFAKAVSKTLTEIIDADVSIHSDGNKIELQCKALGTEYSVASAIKALCDCANIALIEKTRNIGKYSVGCYVAQAPISKYAQLKV